MDLPTHQELKVVIVDIVTRARDDDRLDELTVRIVRQEVEKHFSLDEDALGDKEYKSVIKRTVMGTLDTLEKATEESAIEVKSKTSKKVNTTRKETSSVRPSSPNVGETKSASRKRRQAVVPHSDEESPAEEAEASESEAPSSKKASARSKPSKVKSEKPAKSSKTSRKPESEKKYKSKATIESSDDEEKPKAKATPSRSPRKEQASPKPLSAKKQTQNVKKADSDVDMDAPSTSASKPQLSTESPKSSKPKKQEPVRDPMDSELSSVIDEPPKKRQKKQEKGSEKSKKDEKPKRGKKEPMSKDEETVNRLKGIVVACGRRKVWKKEFEGIDKPSQQIKRLHQILGELGMTPRYSLEKAKAIRERRELAQELEDVQQFEKATQRRGGGVRNSPETEASEEESEVADAPVRKKTNARASIMAFLQDQSEEE